MYKNIITGMTLIKLKPLRVSLVGGTNPW